MTSHLLANHRMIAIIMAFSFLFPVGLLMPSDNSSAVYDTISTLVSANISYECNVRSSIWGNGHMLKPDRIYENLNPGSMNYNRESFAVTGFFNTFDVYGNTTPPPSNTTITKVQAYVIGATTLNHGWFSVGFVSSSWYASCSWMINYPTFSASRGAGVNSGDWKNSSLFAWNHNYTILNNNKWDITSLYSWNWTLLRNVNLYLMWVENENTSSMLIDYVGLDVTCENYLVENPMYTPEITFETNFAGLIWLLIIFFPAIAMTQVIPKIGFMAGIVLMLIIMGATQTGFMPVAVIGLIGVGILAFKGE